MPTFDPLAFLAMLRRKSPRLIYANVRERIVFDLVNRIDTIGQVAKEDYRERPSNLAHGLHYSSSWTSEIKFGFAAACDHLGAAFEDYAFIDLGCGKAKVQIVWEQLLARNGLRQPVYGVDYYARLLEQARHNHRKVLKREGTFILADASQIDYRAICPRLIVYLYNPFDGEILARVAAALDGCDVVAIYNNPEHEGVLLACGFAVIAEKLGFHPQAVTKLYRRAARSSARRETRMNHAAS